MDLLVVLGRSRHLVHGQILLVVLIEFVLNRVDLTVHVLVTDKLIVDVSASRKGTQGTVSHVDVVT